MSNVILKSIETIIHLSNNKIHILKFKYSNVTYDVSENASYWKEKAGDSIIHHYHIICKKQNVVCEISINNKDFQCMLVQMDLLE
ncbi:MAG: hypothetical protein ABIY50_07385 [Ignavibacteria bacterium]